MGKYPDKDCYEPLANKRKTVSGQMFDIKREDAFLQAVNYLQENDKGQLTIQDLITKMDQLCESPFSFKHMQRRLLDYFGEIVIINEIKGKPNIITLRSMASSIFQKCYSLPKPEGHDLHKLRGIETAAKLIETDIKAVETRKIYTPLLKIYRLLKNVKLI